MLSAEKAQPASFPMQVLDGQSQSLPSSASSSFVQPECRPAGSVEMHPMPTHEQQTCSDTTWVKATALEQARLSEELIDERREGIQAINRAPLLA